MKTRRFCKIISFIFLFFILNPGMAFSHKVNIFAYLEGEKIVTESYFNDGSPCKDSTIQVFDKNEIEILKGKTDKDGLFSFKKGLLPNLSEDFKIVLTASLGHKAYFDLKASEFGISDSLDKLEQAKEDKTFNEKTSDDNIERIADNRFPQIESERLQKLIEDAVEKAVESNLRPLKRALAEIGATRRPYSDIIGGIGYIFGIMGLILYFKRRDK